MPICYIGIGSNLGNRRKNIGLALDNISAISGTKVLRVARLINSKPIGSLYKQGDFLNSAAKISTKLTPSNLLKELKRIEVLLGRPKRHKRNSSRTIDLDILFYADRIINSKNLIVPHPRVFERDFVIKPLLEIL